MRERRDRARFTLESLERVGVSLELVSEDLQGDVAPQSSVARAVDLSHAARPERTENRVWPQLRASGELQGNGA